MCRWDGDPCAGRGALSRKVSAFDVGFVARGDGGFISSKEARMKMNKPDDRDKDADERNMEGLRASGMVFSRPQLTNSDVKDAVRRVEEHAGQDFDRVNGPEMEALQGECKRRDERAEANQAELRALEEQRRATQPYLIRPACQGIGGTQHASFGQWTVHDRFIFSASLVLMAVVLVAGSCNVYAAIQAAAMPVFLEQPFLAVLLSCVLPAGSFALHAVAEFLSSDRARAQYERAIAALTVGLLLVWAVTFGLNFQLSGTTLDLTSLGESTNQTAVVFTIVQLLAEMCSGTTLALIAIHIHRRYSKEITIDNPEAVELDQRIAQVRARAEPAHERQRLWGRLIQLRAMRALHISEQAALFHAMRRRFDESNPVAI